MFFFLMFIYLFTSYLASGEWSITSHAIEEEEALLKNSTALGLLIFYQNQNYLRYLIRMQQFLFRDRGTIKYPVAFYTQSKHSILWVSETGRI